MDVPLHLRNEARACLQLARTEAHPEMKTILMGMALGWLTLADDLRRPVSVQRELIDNFSAKMNSATLSEGVRGYGSDLRHRYPEYVLRKQNKGEK